MTILPLSLHVGNRASWVAHREVLEKLREPLLKRTTGDFLVAELERIITERTNEMFGEGTEFAEWLVMLERCEIEVGQSEPEAVTEEKGEGANFREPAATSHVRIMADGADVSSALAAMRAFKESADDELDKLRLCARSLKIPADALDRIRDARGAETVREGVAELEGVIQAAIDGIFVALDDLAQRVPQAVQAAARATTVGYTDAVRRTAASELAEVEVAATSRASDRTKSS